MRMKDKIPAAIEDMERKDLGKVYDYMRAIRSIKAGKGSGGRMTIEQIQEMTRGSESSWGDAAIEEREDRLGNIVEEQS